MKMLGLSAFGPLYRNLVKRDVRQRYKGSVLGLAWTLINPLIVVVAYSVVFKFLFGSPIPNYALFLFVGLLTWTVFYGGITVGSQSLVSNSALVTKVRFPREIIPLASMTANGIVAGAMLVIALPLCIWLGPGSKLPLIALPAFLIMTLVAMAGIGLLLSALNVYFRDVEHILAAIGVPWFFLTPIFYTYSTLPAAAAQHQTLIDILHWGNPISPFVVAIQDVLFFGQWPTLADTIYCLIAAGVFIVLGVVIFKRLEREMAVEL
jgi:lipopolysaccharide transport system permease protein